jgi:hypothetical protein
MLLLLQTAAVEHALGTQVDMFHVFTFPGGAVSGMANYLQLRANVELALTGNIPARTRIDSWAADTRARFNALIAEPQVHRIVTIQVPVARGRVVGSAARRW